MRDGGGTEVTLSLVERTNGVGAAVTGWGAWLGSGLETARWPRAQTPERATY